MAKLNKSQVHEIAKSLIGENPNGIRYTALVNKIIKRGPETPANSVHGWVWNLNQLFPDEIAKPSRGLFVPVDGATVNTAAGESQPAAAPSGKLLKEGDFYRPFADWLKEELDEVTTVAPLGGNGLKAKWGTPDVVGVYKPLANQLIKFDIEIVSAEIKIGLESLCMLFGIGLAVFSLDKDSPNFSIRMRAQRYSPDMFYVNEFADRLNRHDPSVYQKLFG